MKAILGNFVFYNEENKSKEIQGKNVSSFTKFVLGGFCLGGFCPGGFCQGVYVQGVFVWGVSVLSPKTASEKKNAVRQGTTSSDGCTIHCMKLRINAGDKDAEVVREKAIADAYRNMFIISLDFEMLDSLAPYYQAGPGNRLCYEITFNDYN